MACAGFLVQNATTVVYAEITTGLLACSAAARHGGADDASTSHALPPLAPKRMTRSAPLLVSKLKCDAMDSPQPEDEDDLDNFDVEAAKSDHAEPRNLQLSGYVIEVVDCDDEEESTIVPTLPFSFRVKTKRMTLLPDASFTVSPVDSMLLAATDQATKDEWMKRLAKWNRYGWRETTFLAATDEDAQRLEATLMRWRENEANATVTAATFAAGYTMASCRSSRRRFYRNTGAIPPTLAQVDQVAIEGSEGLQT